MLRAIEGKIGKLKRTKEYLSQLQADQKSGKVRLCFGSKKLFKKQFNLQDNGYSNHAEWLRDWQETRDSHIFMVGSKDETAGCQICQATLQADGKFTLKLRVPPSLETKDKEGKIIKYHYIKDVEFKYGKEHILAALDSCRDRFANKDKTLGQY